MQHADHYVATLLSVFAAKPDRVVLWWRDRPITAAEFSSSITTAALVLRREGIDDTSTVTLLTAGNSPEMLIVRYAANLLGATVLHPQSLNAVNPLDEMSVGMQADILEESRTALLVIDSANVERAREICVRMVTPPTIAMFGEDGADVVNLSSATEDVDMPNAVSGKTAMVAYTSGSTSRPKGVGRAYVTIERMVTQAKAAAEKPVMLITTPLGQAAASMVDATLAGEGTVVLHDGFDAGAVLATVAKRSVTRLYLAAPQLYQLVDHPARAATDTSSIQQIVYSGCSASPRRLSQAFESFGPVLVQMYGMTEALAISILGPAEHANPKLLTTVGRPLPMLQVAIRNPSTGEELPIGEAGEICVRSPHVMDGYWHNPELTAQMIRAGWLHTGDVGYLDAEGYLHLVDRLAGMVKTGGIKVYPATIENALLAHPAVAQAAVFGVSNTDKVEYAHAAVVAHRGVTIDPAELREHVARVLSAAHAPAVINVLAELPVLTSGKPDRRRLGLEAEIAAGWRLPDMSGPIRTSGPGGSVK